MPVSNSAAKLWLGAKAFAVDSTGMIWETRVTALELTESGVRASSYVPGRSCKLYATLREALDDPEGRQRVMENGEVTIRQSGEEEQGRLFCSDDVQVVRPEGQILEDATKAEAYKCPRVGATAYYPVTGEHQKWCVVKTRVVALDIANGVVRCKLQGQSVFHPFEDSGVTLCPDRARLKVATVFEWLYPFASVDVSKVGIIETTNPEATACGFNWSDRRID